MSALLLLTTPAFSADVRAMTFARFDDGSLLECVSVAAEGFSDEDIQDLAKKLGDGAIRIEEPCDDFAKRQGAPKLATCLLEKKSDGKRLTVHSFYYGEDQTYSDGGFKDQCKEMKGKWSETSEGVKAAARVALPKANAQEIGAEYQDNEVAADKKYKGKKFLLSGEVQSVKKDGHSRAFIQAKGGNMFVGVHLYVKDVSFAAGLNAGDKVKLQCTGKGKGSLAAPTFECFL